MRPENVNPGNYTVERIIYDQDGFSIAIGTWNDDGTMRFAMRWNEKDGNPPDDEDKGYPTSRQHPMWFQLPDDITDILQVLAENNS